MAKAKHPKLEWREDGDGDWIVAGAHGATWRFGIVPSPCYAGFYRLFRGAELLGYARTVDSAKAIAQAFADAETLRGEGG